MKAATGPRRASDRGRLLVVDGAAGAFHDHAFDELPWLLRASDVVVVNDAATLPAAAVFDHGGQPVELRLLFGEEPGVAEAFVLGRGDRTFRTEDRGAPPALGEGAVLRRGGLAARVIAANPESPRRVRVRLEGPLASALLALYREARPVQYAYVPDALELWDVQTAFAGRPWASEMPSAGRPLRFETLDALRKRNIGVTRVTHGAGLSSTGDAALDRMLPLPERYEIDQEAARLVNGARRAGGRVIAVGTTVVRALESAARVARDGRVRAGRATTDLRIGSATPRLATDAILTGIHEEGTSHFELLEAFASRGLLRAAAAHAGRSGYLSHEFGDSMLVLPRAA